MPAPQYSKVKRLGDLTVALVLLIALSPLLAVLAMLVRLKLGSPVLFVQSRPGQFGRPFQLLKFRTMRDGLDDQGQALPDADRLTKFGSALRALSLDELPELWNIMRGEMSFVGPRPLLVRYLPLYSPEQSERHNVLPGLTGWAQIHGRNAVDWPQRLELDRWYAAHCSVRLDLRILIKTVGVVFRRSGINAADSATMPPFQGDKR